MGVNRYQPHVLVLPEDDANRQLVNGFLLDPSLSTRRIQVLPEAGGWTRVLDRFQSDHVGGMDAYPHRQFGPDAAPGQRTARQVGQADADLGYLAGFPRSGGTLIVATHEAEAAALADRVVSLAAGRVV